MAETIDEITIDYEDGDILTTKELDKHILTRGAWTTILFRYQDWDRTKKIYGPVKFSIRRYQKRNGQFMQKSKFAISSKEQAHKIIDTLNKWMEESDPAPEPAND
jgi:hypothetical protein